MVCWSASGYAPVLTKAVSSSLGVWNWVKVGLCRMWAWCRSETLLLQCPLLMSLLNFLSLGKQPSRVEAVVVG